MSELVDMRVFGLLCSHLCHELVNPLGAVNNGIELLMEDGDNMRDEALALVESSAMRTTHRVQFYRSAYGNSGATTLPDLSAVRILADALLEGEKVSLDWPDAARNPPLEDGWGRLLLNMIATATGALPRGGVVVPRVDDSGGAAGRIVVTARGERARISDKSRLVFAENPSIDEIDPYNVQDYFTTRLALEMGRPMEIVENGEIEIEFVVAFGG